MNQKRARSLRRFSGCDLSRDSEHRAHGVTEMEKRLIGQIQPDGKHTFREVNRKEARSTEERYLYRQLKKVYRNRDYEPGLRKTLVSDLKSIGPTDLKGGSNE